MLKHDGEELPLCCIMIELSDMDHWKSLGIELQSFEDIRAGELEVIDAIERGGFLRITGRIIGGRHLHGKAVF